MAESLSSIFLLLYKMTFSTFLLLSLMAFLLSPGLLLLVVAALDDVDPLSFSWFSSFHSANIVESAVAAEHYSECNFWKLNISGVPPSF
jgi:hypothetical protein